MRARTSALLVGAWLAVQAGAGLAQESPAAERQRIDRERQAIDTRYRAEQQDCAQRFAVNACLDEARRRRREAMAPLREQEFILADRERKQRAAARAGAIERKRVEADTRALAPPPMASAVRGRSASAPASRAASAARDKAASPAEPGDSRKAAEKAAEKAAQRASESAQRRQEVLTDRERIRARQAQRALDGKKAAPLPTPEIKP